MPDDEADAPEEGRGVNPLDRLRRSAPAGPGAADAEDEHAWMITYTDMVTLLLTCFIMLISLASFDRDPGPEAMAEARPDVVAQEIDTAPATEPRVPDALFLRQPPDSWTARLSRDLQGFVDRTELGGLATVTRSETEVRVRLAEGVLFGSGQVELQEKGQALLDRLAPILAASPARLEIEGHTDARPISNWLFASNWELSAARAAAVVRKLIAAGLDPERLRAAGLAETVPVASNDTEAGRRANRRVELVLRTPFETPESRRLGAPSAGSRD